MLILFLIDFECLEMFCCSLSSPLRSSPL